MEPNKLKEYFEDKCTLDNIEYIEDKRTLTFIPIDNTDITYSIPKAGFLLTLNNKYQIVKIFIEEDKLGTVNQVFFYLRNDIGTLAKYSSRYFKLNIEKKVCSECNSEIIGRSTTIDNKTYCGLCIRNLHINICDCCNLYVLDVNYTFGSYHCCLGCYMKKVKESKLTECNCCHRKFEQKNRKLSYCDNCVGMTCEQAVFRLFKGSPMTIYTKNINVQNTRTFGVELEVIAKTNNDRIRGVEDWELIVDNVVKCHKELSNIKIAGISLDKYLIPRHDGSLDRDKGVEFNTVILCNTEGFTILAKILEVMNKYFDVDKKCGLHVHLGVNDFDKEKLQSLYVFYQHFERFFKYYVRKDRINNEYCKKMFKLSKEEIKQINFGTYYFRKYHNKYDEDYNENRRHSVNFDPIKIYGTVEFRIMEGTLDYKKIEDWINLHVTIFEYIKNNELPIDTKKYDLRKVLGIKFYKDLRHRVRVYTKLNKPKIVLTTTPITNINGGQ